MPLAFNREIYASLLARYQPKIIETSEENRAAIALAKSLSDRQDRTGEESLLLQLLDLLIEKYQEKQYLIGKTTCHSLLLHLIQDQNLDITELTEILGSSEAANAVMNGERSPLPEEAKVLGARLHVDWQLLL